MNRNHSQTKRSAFITGATGFIGNHLAERLLRDRWHVHLLTRKESNIKRLGNLHGLLKVHEHNGTTQRAIEIMHQAKPDFVFHLASETMVDHKPEDLSRLIESNITLGAQLLEAMAKTGVRYFINTGTFWQHYHREDYNPVDLYAATKQAFEEILRYYTECKSLCAITLKLFDVYGPNDHREKLFTVFKKISKTDKVLLMSPGEQVLDLVYIDDVVEAYLRAAKLLASNQNRAANQSYVVNSSRQVTLKKVAAIYEKVAGEKLNIRWGGRPYRAREIMLPWRGKRLPGWKPTVNLETGIRRTKGTAVQYTPGKPR